LRAISKLRAWFLAPAASIQAALFLAPLGIVLAYSLLTRGPYGGVSQPWTLENYLRLADPLYGIIFLRSFLLAGVAALLCLVLGFPLALYISRAGRWRNLLLQLVILPFWTSFLIRTYAWIFLLRDTGLFNQALLALGWIAEPLPMLYTDGAVVLGLVYGYLPFMVLPLYATLERLDRSLVEASADLGARPWTTFRHVILPLSLPGIRAGTLLVFVPCLGAYLTPDLMGGGKTVMIGNLVQNQFTAARDWPFGSALSIALMGVVMLLLAPLLSRREEDLL
jgi:spermidine/putrescine transport system permease protein